MTTIYLFLVIFFVSATLCVRCDEKKIEETRSGGGENEVYKVHDSIVNPYNFKSLINPGSGPCQNATLLAVYVHTSPGNLKNRMAIRDTWASRTLFPQTTLVFMTGRSKSERLNELLALESSIYHDIVQDDFLDTYQNLTYKSMMAMKWIDKYCHHVKFVLKTDDDVLVNTFNLVRNLSSLIVDKTGRQGGDSTESTLWCHLNLKMRVVRETKSKWHVSRGQFKDDYFGKYCAGAAFVMSGDLAGKLYEASQRVNFFWIDDFFLTGVATRAVKSGVNHVAINSLYALHPREVEERMMSRERVELATFAHLGRRVSIDKMYKVWKEMVNFNS